MKTSADNKLDTLIRLALWALTFLIEPRLAQLKGSIMAETGELITSIEGSVTTLLDALQGLEEDFHTQKARIEALEAVSGGMTPEQKARLEAVAAATATLATRYANLDALIPPRVPPVEQA